MMTGKSGLLAFVAIAALSCATLGCDLWVSEWETTWSVGFPDEAQEIHPPGVERHGFKGGSVSIPSVGFECVKSTPIPVTEERHLVNLKCVHGDLHDGGVAASTRVECERNSRDQQSRALNLQSGMNSALITLYCATEPK